MKLWLLRPVNDRAQPWTSDAGNPRYDVSMGFVVRAETDAEARRLADAHTKEYELTHGAWLDSALTTCVELPSEGDPGVVMSDFAAG